MLIENGYVEISFELTTLNCGVFFYYYSKLTVNLVEMFISTSWHGFFYRLCKADLFYLFIYLFYSSLSLLSTVLRKFSLLLL